MLNNNVLINILSMNLNKITSKLDHEFISKVIDTPNTMIQLYNYSQVTTFVIENLNHFVIDKQFIRALKNTLFDRKNTVDKRRLAALVVTYLHVGNIIDLLRKLKPDHATEILKLFSDEHLPIIINASRNWFSMIKLMIDIPEIRNVMIQMTINRELFCYPLLLRYMSPHDAEQCIHNSIHNQNEITHVLKTNDIETMGYYDKILEYGIWYKPERFLTSELYRYVTGIEGIRWLEKHNIKPAKFLSIKDNQFTNIELVQWFIDNSLFDNSLFEYKISNDMAINELIWNNRHKIQIPDILTLEFYQLQHINDSVILFWYNHRLTNEVHIIDPYVMKRLVKIIPDIKLTYTFPKSHDCYSGLSAHLPTLFTICKYYDKFNYSDGIYDSLGIQYHLYPKLFDKRIRKIYKKTFNEPFEKRYISCNQLSSDACLICLDNDNVYTLRCGHQFHMKCIVYNGNKQCPLCRAYLVINIYNTLDDKIEKALHYHTRQFYKDVCQCKWCITV